PGSVHGGHGAVRLGHRQCPLMFFEVAVCAAFGRRRASPPPPRPSGVKRARPGSVVFFCRGHSALNTSLMCQSKALGDGRSTFFAGTVTSWPSSARYSSVSGNSLYRRGLTWTLSLGETDR